MMSGLGMLQPSTKCFGAGISFAFPIGAPSSTHPTSVSISVRASEGLFANLPNCGSANHGGILRSITAPLIALAHGRACSYVSSENGAAWPGRWHVWQLRCKIGATSLAKVGAAVFIADCGCRPMAALALIKKNSILRINFLV